MLRGAGENENSFSGSWGSTSNDFQGTGEQTLSFGELESTARL